MTGRVEQPAFREALALLKYELGLTTAQLVALAANNGAAARVEHLLQQSGRLGHVALVVEEDGKGIDGIECVRMLVTKRLARSLEALACEADRACQVALGLHVEDVLLRCCEFRRHLLIRARVEARLHALQPARGDGPGDRGEPRGRRRCWGRQHGCGRRAESGLLRIRIRDPLYCDVGILGTEGGRNPTELQQRVDM